MNHLCPACVILHARTGWEKRAVSATILIVTQMVLPSLLVISQGWGLIDLPLRATFSPAHPPARRDVPLARARGVRDRALREHRRSTGPIPSVLQARNRQACTGCPAPNTPTRLFYGPPPPPAVSRTLSKRALRFASR